MPGPDGPRYAVYFVPASGSALAEVGSAVLGYDARQGVDVAFIETCGISDGAWSQATSEPRRYGFHATLKAPFRLMPGVSESELLAAVQELASRQQAVEPMTLVVKELTHFVALVPAAPLPALDRLASQIVVDLDGLRAPLTRQERERRIAAGLSDRQRAYLEAYGYPYVLEEFRFHMTLAGPLDPTARTIVKERLCALFAPIDRDCAIDALTVLRQDSAKSRFRVIARCPLERAQGRAALR